MDVNTTLFSRIFKRKKLVLLIISLFIFSIVTGFTVHQTTKASVVLVLNGEEVQIKSHAKTVAELLEEENIVVAKHDFIEPNLDDPVVDNMSVTWKQAKPIVLTVDGQSESIWTTEDTVQAVLAANNLEVKQYDKVTPALSTSITEDLEIEFQTAFEIPLIVGGEEQRVWTTETTVAHLLEREKIDLNELDRVEPEETDKVTSETEIHVIRVEKVTDVVEELVDFATVTKKDNRLPEGKEKVVSAGEQGKVKKHYEVTLENGEVVDRQLIKEEKVKDSKQRVVAVGTKKVQPTVSRKASTSKTSAKKSEPPSGGKTIYMSSTAYTANCGGCSGITATGINLKANPDVKVIAVDPNVIPLGTRVHVSGYGYAIAADTGGSIKGNRIDVFFPSKSKANSWGRKNVEVKILN